MEYGIYKYISQPGIEPGSQDCEPDAVTTRLNRYGTGCSLLVTEEGMQGGMAQPMARLAALHAQAQRGVQASGHP